MRKRKPGRNQQEITWLPTVGSPDPAAMVELIKDKLMEKMKRGDVNDPARSSNEESLQSDRSKDPS